MTLFVITEAMAKYMAILAPSGKCTCISWFLDVFIISESKELHLRKMRTSLSIVLPINLLVLN